MTWSGMLFVVSFVSLVYFVRGAVRVFCSPQYKREAAMLRSVKRIRKASRR